MMENTSENLISMSKYKRNINHIFAPCHVIKSSFISRIKSTFFFKFLKYLRKKKKKSLRLQEKIGLQTQTIKTEESVTKTENL